MRSAPIAYLRELFEYDQEHGTLRWKWRPRSHFKTDRAWKNSNARFAGKEAGCVYKSTGYRIVNLGIYGFIGAHRIAIAMNSGEWPEFVDHVNGNPLDNSIVNLRPCSKAENCRNRKVNASNRSGLKGVSRDPSVRRWKARIQVDKKQIHLGMFDTPEQAHAAYVAASRKYHGNFANPG